MDSTRVRTRCTIIGAGVSGILMACKLRMHLEDYVEFQLLEKNPELGGTWYENRYPGCACDVPSHCYQFTFAPNPEWSKLYSSSSEINNYLKAVARRFELERYIRYNTKVVSATWSEASSTWAVVTESGESIESEILVNAGGILNNYQMPDIKGLETFKGKLLHTAAWDSSVDFQDKKVAMIGSGASAVQVLPQIQPLCDKVSVFIRTPSWISPPFVKANVGAESSNYVYTETEKSLLRRNEQHYIDMRKEVEDQFNGMFDAFFKATPEQNDMRNRFEARMKTLIKDEQLQKNLIPSFEAGCRRINPGEQFLVSIQEANVQPVFDAIEGVTQNGIVAGGKEYAADILVAATGFNTSFRPRFPIYGKGGANLQDVWATAPASYMGTGVSGFPNYLIYLGPNTPISNGSLMGPLEATSDYFIRIMQRMIRNGAKSFNVQQQAQDDFNTHINEFMKGMVWTGSCRSWFKKGSDGKVTALWPGSGLHYMQCLSEDRWEDYEWEYKGERYAYWGRGFSWIEKPDKDPLGLQMAKSAEAMTTLPTPRSDLSFYIGKATNISKADLYEDARGEEGQNEAALVSDSYTAIPAADGFIGPPTVDTGILQPT